MIIDFLWLITGSAIAYLSSLTGAAIERRRVTRINQQQGNVCGCGHDYVFHNRDNECVVRTKQRYYRKNGTRGGWQWMQCRCLGYSGIAPIDLGALGLSGFSSQIADADKSDGT